MSETITLPHHFHLLYYDEGEWNLVKLELSACASFYAAIHLVDILHESETLKDLLREYGIMTVVFVDRHIILNRGDVVERLKDLVTAQEQNFDSACVNREDHYFVF